MIKFKLTLVSGLTVENLAPSMVDAIKYVEARYQSMVMICEMIL